MSFSLRKATAVAIIAVLAIATPAWAANWRAVAAKARQSLVSIQDKLDGAIYCSGIVIDDKRDFVLTADHCTNVVLPDGTTVGMYIDGKQAWEIWHNEEWDLSILKVEGLDRPAVTPGMTPEMGQEAAALGFGYGLPGTGMFRTGEVSGYAMFEDSPGRYLILNFGIIPGMSGGPMIDADGKLIGINQMVDPNGTIGIGREIADIYRMTKDFWEIKKD